MLITHATFQIRDVLLQERQSVPAGVFIPPDDRTEEDFEVTMGIDHFAPFYMTHLLLQNLEQNAPSRIVNLG